MKKNIIYIIGLSLLSITSVSAGTDTDRVCSYQTQGKFVEGIQVTYPGERVEIQNVWKQDPISPYIPDPIQLLYVVNIVNEKKKYDGIGIPKKRSELYAYDCQSKNAKLLYTLDNTGSFSYAIQHVQNGIITMTRGGEDGELSETLEQVTVFDSKIKKLIFTINNTNRKGRTYDDRGLLLLNLPLPGSVHISGFISGKRAWYLYFTITDPVNGDGPALYSIDKKTKRITKL